MNISFRLHPLIRLIGISLTAAVCLTAVTRSSAQSTLPRSAEYTRQAWIALSTKDFSRALQLTEQVIAEFRADARAKQTEIEEKVKMGIAPPPSGSVSQEVFDRVMENGPINDVGTCYVIRGRAFRALHNRQSALASLREGRALTYARAWDSNDLGNGWNKNGWLWSTSRAADDEIRDLSNWGEIIAYGSFALRENNLTNTTFRSAAGTYDTDIRLFLNSRSFAPGLRPYITLRPAWSSKNISVENTLTYGAGIENRPFSRQKSLATRPELEWLTRLRLYTEFLGQGFFYGANPSWNPRENWSVGFDLWRQYGYVDPERSEYDDPIWGELFIGAAHHSTNFYIRNFDAFRAGFNGKLGAKLGSKKLPFMPYFCVDLNASSRYADQFFNNRLLGSIGARTELRYGHEGRMWIFAEYRSVLGYLKDNPPNSIDIPRSEFRVGVTFQFGRY